MFGLGIHVFMHLLARETCRHIKKVVPKDKVNIRAYMPYLSSSCFFVAVLITMFEEAVFLLVLSFSLKVSVIFASFLCSDSFRQRSATHTEYIKGDVTVQTFVMVLIHIHILIEPCDILDFKSVICDVQRPNHLRWKNESGEAWLDTDQSFEGHAEILQVARVMSHDCVDVVVMRVKVKT